MEYDLTLISFSLVLSYVRGTLHAVHSDNERYSTVRSELPKIEGDRQCSVNFAWLKDGIVITTLRRTLVLRHLFTSD